MFKLLPLMALAAMGRLASEGAELATTGEAQVLSVPGVECEVRVTKAGSGIELTAVALANRRISGVYRFDVKESGSAGSSTVHQGGEFALQAGREQVLGSAWLGSGAQAAYVAQLTLSDGRGELLCTTKAEALGAI